MSKPKTRTSKTAEHLSASIHIGRFSLECFFPSPLSNTASPTTKPRKCSHSWNRQFWCI